MSRKGILITACVTFFRPNLAIAEATATHLSLTTYLCYGADKFLLCPSGTHVGVPSAILRQEIGGKLMTMFMFIPLTSQLWDSFFTAFQNTEPRLSTDNQLDNSPLNRLPSFLLHPPPCSWSLLSKIYYSHASHCLSLLWGTQARSDEYGKLEE